MAPQPPNPARAAAYVATLPGRPFRREAQERIEAGLRVRQMPRCQKSSTPHEPDVSPSPLKGERAGVRGEAVRLIDSGQMAVDESQRENSPNEFALWISSTAICPLSIKEPPHPSPRPSPL